MIELLTEEVVLWRGGPGLRALLLPGEGAQLAGCSAAAGYALLMISWLREAAPLFHLPLWLMAIGGLAGGAGALLLRARALAHTEYLVTTHRALSVCTAPGQGRVRGVLLGAGSTAAVEHARRRRGSIVFRVPGSGPPLVLRDIDRPDRVIALLR